METVAVIGLGYIGLPTAAILASHGTRVIGVDVNPVHVDAVNRGEVPFVEPDLGTHVAGAVAQGMLTAQKDTPKADCYIIAVPTPFADGHQADLSYIDAAVDTIIPHLDGGELIILESTCPPGATKRLACRIANARPEISMHDESHDRLVDVAHCPERVLPGRVMVELVINARIVGGLTARAAQRARDLYRTFCTADILLTDAMTAEMTKLAENAFRDVNIAFANELSVISDRLGVNVFELIDLANHHPRVNIHRPGPGVGGHCVAVDPWFLVSAAPEDSRLIRMARAVNDGKPDHVIKKVAEAVGEGRCPTIVCLGLTFKADIDDMRESPALEIVTRLARLYPEGRILAVEPHVSVLPDALDVLPNVDLVGLEDAVAVADVVVVLVDHRQFQNFSSGCRVSARIVDTRGLGHRSAAER